MCNANMPSRTILYKLTSKSALKGDPPSYYTLFHLLSQARSAYALQVVSPLSPSSFIPSLRSQTAHKGGSKNSLKELEKKATATPKMATLLITLAFSGDVKALYALATYPLGAPRREPGPALSTWIRCCLGGMISVFDCLFW